MTADNAVEQAIYKIGGVLFGKIINPLIILFVSLAIILFLYIIARSLWKGSQGYGKEAYTSNLLWPIVGLTIMFSAVGITYFIGNTGNEIFQGGKGGKATQGIDKVVRPVEIH